ncbi:MAG: aromatic ring-hydroxylating dioxygenase subunit alpha [Gammaproteobacteria bacterium]|nr:MAG: aromatic ring-hydroxylating dioxygenase subunit alpha [Gammaproteobacteria bacterium]
MNLLHPQPAQLVSDDGCYISRRVFTSRHVYDWEKRYILGRSWLFLTHDSQIPNPGDFVTTYMGETPVIVARGSDGKVHVSINSCSHRGLPVCRADRGNAKRFICPYHNWSYTVEGQLHTVPQEKKVQQPVDKARLGLKAVPRVESYGGLIFGCLDAGVEPLESFLGDMRWYLDCMFDRYPKGIEVIGSPHKWLINANWKLPVENQLGDVGHGPYLHGSLLKDTPQVADLEAYGMNVVPKAGHGVSVRLMPKGASAEQCMWGTDGLASFDPEVKAYLLESHKAVESRLGEVRSRLRPLCFSIYPNFSFLWPNNTIRISHPRGPGQVEYWSWWVVEKDAPDHIKKKLQQNYTFFFGPGGVLEQEDSEAWSQQFIGSNIDYVDDAPLYYGLGMGEEVDHEEIPGRTGSCFNEHYARDFYKRWRQEIEDGLKGDGGAA